MTLSKYLAVSVIVVSLSACGDEDINKVKNFKPNGNASFSEVLDKWKICGKTSWNKQPGLNGSIIVTYTCDVEDIKNYMNAVRGVVLKNEIDNKHQRVTPEFVSHLKEITDFESIKLNILFNADPYGHINPYQANTVYRWNDGVSAFNFSRLKEFFIHAKLNDFGYFQIKHGKAETPSEIEIAANDVLNSYDFMRKTNKKDQP